jgi:hypothetical protein
VTRFLELAQADPAEVVVDALPPSAAACIREKFAINAVMAGAPAKSLPLLAAALQAMSVQDPSCTRSTPPPDRSSRCCSSTVRSATSST